MLEVLVAMTILAVALGAMIRSTGDAAANVNYLREKTLAAWVAENQIAERLLTADWPADPDLRRIDVTVAGDSDPDTPLATLTAFRGRGS